MADNEKTELNQTSSTGDALVIETTPEFQERMADAAKAAEAAGLELSPISQQTTDAAPAEAAPTEAHESTSNADQMALPELDPNGLSDITTADLPKIEITPEFQEKMADAAKAAEKAGLELSPIGLKAAETEPTTDHSDASPAGLAPLAAMTTIDGLNAQPDATATAATPVDGAPIVPPASNEDAAIVSPEFQETSGPISTDPEWAGVSHILYRDPLEIAAVDQAADDAQTTKIKKKHIALQEFVPLDAATLAFLAVRYGGLERDPAFLERIQAKAGAKGVTIEQYLASQETDEQVRADVLKDFAETHPLLNQQGNPLPFVAVRLETRTLEMGTGLPVMALVDNKGNIYRDCGNKTTVLLKKGEKFGASHARNMARAHIARRRNPAADGEEQEVPFKLSTGRGLLRKGLGLRTDKDQYEQSLMLMGVLQEAELGGIKPVIGMKGQEELIKKISRDGKDPSADFGIHPRALEEMRLQCPEIDSLIEKYNNGWPKKVQEYSLEGETPKADAIAPELDEAGTPTIEDPRVEQHPEPVAAANPVTADAASATADAPAPVAAQEAPEVAVKAANPSDILAGSAAVAPAENIVVPTIKPFTRADSIGGMPQTGVPKVGAKADDLGKVIPAEQPEAVAHASSLPAAAARPQTPRPPGM